MSKSHPSQQIENQNTPQNSPSQAPLKTSALERFSLSFEYNKTLQEIKREVRVRTI